VSRRRRSVSAILLGLFGFVIWPLLPNRYVDPWKLLQPREAWVTVVVVACIGFINYVLLRVYGQRGITLTAILGGSCQFDCCRCGTFRVPARRRASLADDPSRSSNLSGDVLAECGSTCSLVGGERQSGSRFYLCFRMTIVCWIFCPSASRGGEKRFKRIGAPPRIPVSLKKVTNFGVLFLAIQIVGTLAVRWFGNSGCPTG